MTEHDAAGGAQPWPNEPRVAIDGPDAAVERARALLDLGRTDEAFDVLRASLAVHPHDPELLAQYAVACYRANRMQEAEQGAQAAAAAEPEWSFPHYLLSAVYSACGMQPQAVRAARDAVRLGPHSASNLLRLADALTDAIVSPRSGRGRAMLSEARSLIDQAAQLAPTSTGHLSSRAAIADKLGDHAEYKRLQREILARDPMDTDAHLDLALADVREAPGLGARESIDSMRGVIDVLRADPNEPRALAALRALLAEILVRFAELFVGATFLIQVVLFVFKSAGPAVIVGAVLLAAGVAATAAIGFRYYRQLPATGRRRLVAYVRERRTMGLLICLALGALSSFAAIAVFRADSTPGTLATVAGFGLLVVGYNQLQRDLIKPRRGLMLLVTLLALAGMLLQMSRAAIAFAGA